MHKNIFAIKLNTFFLTIIMLFLAFPTNALAPATPLDFYAKYLQEKTPLVDKQLRGTWISTVVNIDWPSSDTSKIENNYQRVQKSKEELIEYLDKAVEMKLNAVFFQVGPSGDAFYKSNIVPWSRYLTGTFGKDPGFDPLDFIIDEGHKRNLEIHAWFNPYRISMDTKDTTKKSLQIDKSIYKDHPEWIRTSAGRFVLDPGIPEARLWVIKRVMEVVNNYDVDGVHFDDYFYNENFIGELKDEGTFKTYNKEQFKNTGDFRRNNTYLLIKELSSSVRASKSWVKFGISPAGVWGNKKDGHTDGSNTNTSYTNYEVNFADTKKWVKEELIDYIAPQIYFSFANPRAPYDEVASWWTKVCDNRKVHLYIGNALYKVNEDPDQYFNGVNAIPEFTRQLKFNILNPVISGNIMFTASNFIDSNKEPVVNSIKNDIWSTKTLIPVMPWKGGKAPTSPSDGRLERTMDGLKLFWTDNDTNTSYYAIYRINQDGKNLIATLKKNSNGNQEFIDIANYDSTNSLFVVTALDRLHNESSPLTISIYQSKYFSDVGIEFTWASKPIDLLFEKLVVKGDALGLFHPKDSTKRGDFILMVIKALNIQSDFNDNFTDVVKNSYYYNAIGTAKAQGIVKGSGGLFKPVGNISREDMMVILVNSLEVAGVRLEKAEPDYLNNFKDITSISNYAKESIASLIKADYIKGSNGNLNPKQLATRAECAVILEKVMALN